VWRWIFAVATLLLATSALAQVSFNASIVSDYRFRGVSLSQGEPAAQLTASYDHRSGLYAGIFVYNVQFDAASGREAQLTGFAGFARRVGDGVSVDAGAAFSSFSGGDGYNYLELQAGVTTSALAARLYYAPDYFGDGLRTLYAELNGSHRLADRLKLVAHGGVLKAIGSADGIVSGERPHFDLLAGVEYQFQPFTVQLSRVANDGISRVYPLSANHVGGIWTVRLSAAF
jgi:uncharacterized protein (TIGR02001 family)